MNVVDEAPPTVDLDDRDPLAVLRLELGYAVDRDLAQREAELVARGGHDAAGCLAKMAARRGVERDLGWFYG